MFSYIEEQASGPGLDMTYHLAPWDRPILQGNSGVISSMRLRAISEAAPTFELFNEWCMAKRTLLVSCHLQQDQLGECAFLETRGFRFVELNYRPVLTRLEDFAEDPQLDIGPAAAAEEETICAMAGEDFGTGRLHVDPLVGATFGNRRYASWVANAFRSEHQSVIACRVDGRVAAFIIVESPAPTRRFLSLMGVAKDLRGQGVARRLWCTLLARHAREGVTEVTTSISSLNTATHNLCASTGFRFPAPTITLHWCPFGPVPTPL
jgi:GNAT superfamily N-acetyltransferase